MSPPARTTDRPDAPDDHWVDRYAHVPALVVLTVYLCWTRVRDWQRFVDGGQVLFQSNDAWYHYREVSYTVRNFPQTMPFDPWTAYPTGRDVGQFGTVFDQAVALATLVAGGGSPDETTVGLVLLFAPAVLGTLVVVPTYLLGRHVAGRTGGVAAVTVLALTPGGFLQRTMVGFADHHAAEVLLQAAAMLAVVTAVRVADRREPTLARLRAREFEALRRPLVTAVLSGVAVAAYVLVWPPGVVLGVVLGAFYTVHMSAEFVRGRDPEHVASVAAVSSLTTAVVVLAGSSSAAFEPVSVSLLQPALFVLLAVGLVGMVGLARAFDSRSLPDRYYPAVLAAAGVLAVLVARTVLPSGFAFFSSYVIRVFGYTLADPATVSEARPVAPGSVPTFLRLSYGAAFGGALLGAAVGVVGYWRDATAREWVPALVVWLGFTTAMTLTQVRFDYYLVVPVAVLAGVAVAWAFRRLGVRTLTGVSDVGWPRVVAAGLVVLLLVGPFASSVGVAGPTFEATTAASEIGPGEVTEWRETTSWLGTNTPPEGTYGRPDAEPFGRYPTVRGADGDDFDYPPGTYGVLSWWDSGHFLTVLGERIPVANPFQDGRETAAQFLLSTDESAATEGVTWGDERVRYVVVQWRLAVPSVGTYAAPVAFANGTGQLSDLVRPITVSESRDRRFAGYVKRQAHYETLRVRLFRYHGSARTPRPVVTDWEEQSLPTADSGRVARAVVRPDETFVRRFDTLGEARAYVREDGSAQVGGVDGLPAERVPALEHYRLVHASETEYAAETLSGTERGSFAKVFERVPGATVRGRAPPGSRVTASVELSLPRDRTFTYTQRARAGPDGEFSMTLPYSTTGYDDWGVEAGYTNVSVRATGPYRFVAERPGSDDPVGVTSVHVPERRVVREDSRTVDVTLGSE
jgi:dolichyl-diphosphooligosaccharide--protein glycosyltransferase